MKALQGMKLLSIIYWPNGPNSALPIWIGLVGFYLCDRLDWEFLKPTLVS